MICPYNNFNKCDWENCPARMYVENPAKYGYLMEVCAIAYNGGTLPMAVTINTAPGTNATAESQWSGEKGDYRCARCGAEAPNDGYYAAPHCYECGARMTNSTRLP